MCSNCLCRVAQLKKLPWMRPHVDPFHFMKPSHFCTPPIRRWTLCKAAHCQICHYEGLVDLGQREGRQVPHLHLPSPPRCHQDSNHAVCCNLHYQGCYPDHLRPVHQHPRWDDSRLLQRCVGLQQLEMKPQSQSCITAHFQSRAFARLWFSQALVICAWQLADVKHETGSGHCNASSFTFSQISPLVSCRYPCQCLQDSQAAVWGRHLPCQHDNFSHPTRGHHCSCSTATLLFARDCARRWAGSPGSDHLPLLCLQPLQLTPSNPARPAVHCTMQAQLHNLPMTKLMILQSALSQRASHPGSQAARQVGSQ